MLSARAVRRRHEYTASSPSPPASIAIVEGSGVDAGPPRPVTGAPGVIWLNVRVFSKPNQADAPGARPDGKLITPEDWVESIPLKVAFGPPYPLGSVPQPAAGFGFWVHGPSLSNPKMFVVLLSGSELSVTPLLFWTPTIIIVPALVFLFHLSQHQAQGTTLALLVPPIGLLAAWAYYRQGFVDIRIAALICAGFVLGGLVGAKLSLGLSGHTLQRVFGVALLILGARMIFGSGAS